VIQLRLAYAHDGESVYDRFFLDRFSKKFETFFLTFNKKPIMVANCARTIIMPDLGSPLPIREGIRALLSTPTRVLILKKYLRELKPDILIGNWIWRYGLYCALSGFKPFILFVWGSDILIIPKYSIFLHGLASYVLRKADLILVDSDIQFEACLKLGAKKEKIFKVPWFDVHEVTEIAKKYGARRRIRKELGISDGAFVIICTRRHEKVYDLETLVKAAPRIISRIKNARFILIGGGKLTIRLKALVKKMGLEEHFTFLGQQSRENVIKYLLASDVYVSPSLSDGTSASLLEAMSCKVMPIVTSIPGNREWIINGDSGLLFPPSNHEALADAVVKASLNKNGRQKIVKKAYSVVVSRANWDENFKLFEDSFQRVMKSS